MTITLGSDLHLCFHEAGHIETALQVGAIVHGAVFNRQGDTKTMIEHLCLSTKVPIACGGYAVEAILFDNNQLVDDEGSILSRQEFVAQAMENAQKDKFPFYIKQSINELGVYPGSRFQPAVDGTWPPASDNDFIEYAQANVVPLLRPRFSIITSMAKHLWCNGSLNTSDITSIREF